MPGWEPERYDPQLHQQRLYGQAQPSYPSPGYQGYEQQYPAQGSWPPPQEPRHGRKSRVPLWGGIAAIAILAGGGVTYALAGHSAPAKPLTCPQQYAQWKTGPAHAAGKQLRADAAKLSTAGNSEDIPAMVAALKTVGPTRRPLSSTRCQRARTPPDTGSSTLPPCRRPGTTREPRPGSAGCCLPRRRSRKCPAIQAKLTTELERTAGLKAAG